MRAVWDGECQSEVTASSPLPARGWTGDPASWIRSKGRRDEAAALVLAGAGPAGPARLGCSSAAPVRARLVRSRRLELPRPFGHSHLKAARLPIPPRPHVLAVWATAGRGGAVAGRARARNGYHAPVLKRPRPRLPSRTRALQDAAGAPAGASGPRTAAAPAGAR